MMKMNRLKKIAGKYEETRTYQISGDKEQLDNIEKLLTILDYLGQSGASRTIHIFADGDGAFRIDVRRLPDQKIVKNKLIDMECLKDFDAELDASYIEFCFD